MAVSLVSAMGCSDGGGDTGTTEEPPERCEGIGCSLVDCASQNLPATTVSGTVFAPNGTLPLYGVTVYVPVSAPGALQDGVQCGNCNTDLPGGSYTATITDESGHFTLPDVPAAYNVPLVIQVGKWRRQITINHVEACTNTELAMADTTLPRNHSEGDIPQIAISTGNADALECLVRKLGIDDSEITSRSQGGRVHLYNGNGANTFATGFAGGTGPFPNATTLWDSVDSLAKYDVVMLSCEGGQRPETKPQSALEALHDYADRGGRVFLSHWHNIWIGGDQKDSAHAIPEWQSIAQFDYSAPQNEATQLAFIDQTVPKGPAFAQWLQNVGGTLIQGQLEVTDPRYTAKSIDPNKAERWVYVDPTKSTPAGRSSVQDMMFSTPQSQPVEARCGKVVFSDMHVSAGSTSKSSVAYPGGCSAEPLTAQETALAFMFFDISSCVGTIF